MKKYLLLAALSLSLVGYVTPAGRGPQGRHGAKKIRRRGYRRGVRHLGTRAHFQKLVRESKGGKPLVVKFFATWCGTCKRLAPHFRATKNRFMQDAQFLKVDIDRFKGLAREYGVQGVPTFIVIKDGEESARGITVTTPEKLEEFVRTTIGGTGKLLAANRMNNKQMKLCPCGAAKTVKDCGCTKDKKGRMKGKICPCGSGTFYKECCGMKGKHQLHKRGA